MLKQRLLNRETTIGSWLSIGNEITTEIMAKSGYDWLCIDMEHSAITLDVAQNMIRIIELCGCTPLVRVGVNDETIIKRVMDAGSHGVIVPKVNSKEDALKAVASVQYPPSGARGVGLARAQKYGLGFEQYKHFNQEQSIVIVQIEDIKAVENIREILNTQGVDGFIIGPYDLSASMGYPGEFERPDVKAALDKVKKVSEELNVLSGFHVVMPDRNDLETKKAEGYKFLAYGIDTLFLAESCKV